MQLGIYPSGIENEDQPWEIALSRINGTFAGWKGRTRYELLNGQVWEQQSFECLYRYAFMPRTLVFRAGGRNWMRVEGIPGSVPVRRVK